MRRLTAAAAVVIVMAGACGDDTAAPRSSTTTTVTDEPTVTDPPQVTDPPAVTDEPTVTDPPAVTGEPAPACEPGEAFAVLDAAVADARLVAGGEWHVREAVAAGAGGFAADFADPTTWAEILGLDCAVVATQPDVDDRLALVAWTGPRMALVIRSAEPAEPPHAAISTLSLGFEFPVGELLRDDNSLWGGVLESTETLVVGHIDFNLGVAAKTWRNDAPPVEEGEVRLDSERAAIDALRAVGARNVGIAEPPMFGSEEGYVSFVSPTGQLLVVDVAPLDWFDPTRGRYYHGPSERRSVDGVDVRITEPGPGEGEFDRGVEVGWTCGDHVWILQPAANGGADEMVAFVETLLRESDC